MLESLSPGALFQFTERVISTLAPEGFLHSGLRQETTGGVSRLLLGRCLLTIDATDVAGEVGCSGSIHFAGLRGIDHREAREARRVSRCLEDLPQLRKAAEEGAVDWASLREIVRKASPETEERWLQLAHNLNYRKIARIVSRTRVGEIPVEDLGPEVDPVETLIQCRLDMIRANIMQEVMRKLSEEHGRPVTFTEHLEILWAQYLTGDYSPESVRKICDEAAKDVAAQRPARVEETPWAAVAATEDACPEAPEMALVQAAPPHWTNERLRFNENARGLTPAQRQEILRRDAYRCSTPGCPNHLWLEVHHIVFYSRGGATVPGNVLIACGACHRNVHKNLLRITGQAPDGLTWSNRQGFRVGGVRAAEWLGLLNTC